jgi:hypothetical protein
MLRWTVATCVATTPLVMACSPPHYTVAVARGPTHVTYAQRHAKVSQPDYLVDCLIGPDGRPTHCAIVPLEEDE